jgi:hypothetical protein
MHRSRHVSMDIYGGLVIVNGGSSNAPHWHHTTVQY